VGKLNPSKLGNFLEIECFILVACPENSLVESKVGLLSNFGVHTVNLAQDFLRPIVTPYELEIALQVEQSWTGRYVLNFEQILAESGQKSTNSMLHICSLSVPILRQSKQKMIPIRRKTKKWILINRSFLWSLENTVMRSVMVVSLILV
jgi:hypothetical protein